MALQTQIMAAGVPAATAIVGVPATGLVAAGTTNADALAIGAAHNAFATVGSGAGAILSNFQPGDSISVYNGGANALLVYPPALSQINNLTLTTAGFSIGTQKTAIFIRQTATLISVALGA